MLKSVLSQPGAGFHVWLILVVVASLWGWELLNTGQVSGPTAATSSPNVILGLLELWLFRVLVL